MKILSSINFGYYGSYYGGYYDRRPYGPYDKRAPKYDGVTDINRYRGRFPRFDQSYNYPKRRPHEYLHRWNSYGPHRGQITYPVGLPC